MLSASKEAAKLIENHSRRSYVTALHRYHSFTWHITAAQFNTRKTHFL